MNFPFRRNRPLIVGLLFAVSLIVGAASPTSVKSASIGSSHVAHNAVNSRGELVDLRQPYVIDELCIGCGVCENRCPLSGGAAVIVTSEGESRQRDRIARDGY